jgi:hypothetical protein
MSTKDTLQRYEPEMPDAAAHMFSSVLEKFKTRECSTNAFAVPCRCPDHGNTEPLYTAAQVRALLADAHAHYEAQVRPLGGLARPDAAAPPADRALQLMKLVERYGGMRSRLGACHAHVSAVGPAATECADLYNRINALAQEMVADAERYLHLRDHCVRDDGDGWMTVRFDTNRLLHQHPDPAEWIDADIDAAMKEKKP